MEFKFYNPNPKQRYHADGTPCKWNRTDCVVRAFARAYNYDWTYSYKRLCEESAKLYMTMSDPDFIKKALIRMGWDKIELDPKQVVTIKQFADQYGEGTYLLMVNGHTTCIVDGVLYDTWDCSSKRVRNAFIK